ncbi:MAG: tyrosine-type recombinase/integrase [Candidatus Diapherotrites archaeon]|nr:tyrosine-type recombinase/integrase [Candidatus Diapherotrites archaeon]
MAIYRDLYDCRHGFNYSINSLKTSGISKTDLQDVLDFSDDMLALGISYNRMRKAVPILRWHALQLKELDTTFRKAKDRDIKKLILKVERDLPIAEWTKQDYKKVLKRFYKWLLGKDLDHPDIVRWIKTRQPKNSMLPEDLLTESDALKLVEHGSNLRDKAFIFVLYESGARLGEMLSLQIKDVVFGEHITSISVKGKTGQRRIPLVACSSYLSNWINQHPFKDNPEAMLWTSVRKTYSDTENSMNPRTIKKMLEHTAKLAGIKKRINPHSFRHARATILAKKLTEAELKMYFGWTQDSDMAARYVHLSGRDIDNAILKVHGIKISEESAQETVSIIQCKRCDTKNPSVFKLCKKCGNALSEKASVEVLATKTEQSYEFLNNVVGQLKDLENKGLDLKQFSEFLNEWSKNKK